MNIDETLKERGARYGKFPEHAFITQELKRTLHDNINWSDLADDQKEALDMVMHKIGRIINGDPNYIDSWTDIIGYTRLVEKRLIAEQQTAKVFAFPTDNAKQQADLMSKLVADALTQTNVQKFCDCSACQLHCHMKNVLRS